VRNITIKSSLQLTQDQRELLEQGIKNKSLGEVTFNYVLDDSVIGIIVLDGETLVDASLTAELHRIKKNYDNLYADMRKGISVTELPHFIKDRLSSLVNHHIDIKLYGKVVSVADGIVKITGLSTCKYGELIVIGRKNSPALVMNLERESVGAILLSSADEIEYGDFAYSIGKILEVPVGKELLGRIVNPLGVPVDGLGRIRTKNHRRVESDAPPIRMRDKVNEPLYTGILAIDAMIPIGKGQRELIIGDRQTGKTSIAVDAIINQAGKGVYCVYVAIGQKASSVNKLVKTLKKHDALRYTVIVYSTASDPPSLQYIAPYAGAAIAEHFMYEGKDALIIYDDLSKHAVAYRTISLLLRRPVGREAYPGDIFYIHSRLLERAAKLNASSGGGSLTALPIIETQAGDISSYIPTNVISITDGQIYLERELFNSGIRPAINVGLSVSRVGGSAQNKMMNKLSAKIRLALSHYKELQIFTQFGASIEEETRKTLESGARIVEALKQKEHHPLSVLKEEIFLIAITNGYLKSIKIADISRFLDSYYAFALEQLGQTSGTEHTLSKEEFALLSEVSEQFVEGWGKGL